MASETTSLIAPQRAATPVSRVAKLIATAAGCVGMVAFAGVAVRSDRIQSFLGQDQPSVPYAMGKGQQGPLSPGVRNGSPVADALVLTKADLPACTASCVFGDIDDDATLDASYCSDALFNEDMTSCVEDQCVGKHERKAHDKVVQQLCPEGKGDVSSELGRKSMKNTFRAEIGSHDMGPGGVFADMDTSLYTYQCDANACERFNPNDPNNPGDGGMYQYVDDSCGAVGTAAGCEGAMGGETGCRMCVLGSNTNFPGNQGYPQCPMCVCEEYGFDREKCNPCTAFYEYFKFDVHRTKSATPLHNAMQFADLTLFDGDGNNLNIDVSQSTNPGGRNPPGQAADGGTDGDMNTKFLDGNFIANGGSTMIFKITGGPQMVRGYEFFTAGDQPNRDPVDWTLYGGASPSGPWYEFSTISDANPPSARLVSYGVFDPCRGN